MDLATTLTILVSVGLGVAGYLFTYVNDRSKARRRDQLDRVSRQIRELYGPVYVLSEASNRTWRAFRSTCRPTGSFFDPDEPPTDDDLAAWRLWIVNVFQPTNERLVETVFAHADLLEESEIPPVILQAVAHVQAHRTLIAKWGDSDYTEHAPPLNFPGREIQQWAAEGYQRLKMRQRELLGAEPNDSVPPRDRAVAVVESRARRL